LADLFNLGCDENNILVRLNDDDDYDDDDGGGGCATRDPTHGLVHSRGLRKLILET
jgi:hypothetical protein